MFNSRPLAVLALTSFLLLPAESWSSPVGAKDDGQDHAVSMTAGPAEADGCTAIINGQKVTLKNPTEGAEADENFENTTFREAIFSGWSGKCPGYVVLKHLTPELTTSEREAFCLSYDGEAEQYLGFEQGVRDAYGVCQQPSRTMCERVNAGKELALAVSGLGVGASAATTGTMAAAGVTAVTHSSGAVILTGTSGYIGGTLGTAAASALGILSAPAVLAGSAVALVAVGGAVYVCQE